MSLPSHWPIRQPWAVGLANYLNLKTLPLHANQVVITAVVYQALFTVASPLISRALVPKTYDGLSEKSRVNWNARVVGLCQATFISAKALAIILTDETRPSATAQQRLWGYTPATGELQAFASGYFLWDIYISLRCMSQFGPTAAIHAVTAFVITLLGFKPFANYYGVNFVLYELSTPFLNVHWMLDKLGKTGSDLQLYNGIILTTTFFGCRLVWGSYQTWLLTTDMLSAWRSGPVPRLLFATYLLGNATLTGLNFYWFGKMIRTLQKRFSSKKAEK